MFGNDEEEFESYLDAAEEIEEAIADSIEILREVELVARLARRKHMDRSEVRGRVGAMCCVLHEKERFAIFDMIWPAS